MKSWSDSATVSVGQCISLGAGLSYKDQCTLIVSLSNPDCSTIFTVSGETITTQTNNDDAVRSIEVVRSSDSSENCSIKIVFIVSYDGDVNTNCSIIGSESDILWVDLTLD